MRYMGPHAVSTLHSGLKGISAERYWCDQCGRQYFEADESRHPELETVRTYYDDRDHLLETVRSKTGFCRFRF